MEGENTKPKILIFGGTGYLGKYMVKASVSSGHKTFVYARPVTKNSRPSKLEIHKEFQGIGVTIIEGELDEHEKIVSILKEVDVVISTVAYPQFLDQLKIVHAIKVAGNIKRFLPSEFGCEEDRVRPLPPFEAYLEKKRIVRRAIEAVEIPYTFVSANCYGAYFVNVLLRPFEPHDDVVVYGNGEAKALSPPEDIPISIIHSALAKGDLMNFELGEDDIEASMLYPDFKFATIDQLLDIFLIDPPKPARTAFE
ncbi:isoflavone reductase [Citrus sinensis]|nr:isoflavone reductase [Citrus sinensis]